jgi:DNA-binding Lrp family transcriptional regulator
VRELVRELVRDEVADRFDVAVRFVRLGTGLRDVMVDLLWSI